eukprot:gnl/TRDRNA2_/TRDRNA2_82011_c0_seq2.p1 gnl/TRDRNA2_/TRDRNA2_82011_c0~~gnl/TRDRNA2_/TRDRNA2_82011_c0_seq2.p1  ORF type:complete len:215 (+),score=25.11 gnl/TRDRNA2_/TRDRNA2_82011_c0_seq2:67-645(+)
MAGEQSNGDGQISDTQAKLLQGIAEKNRHAAIAGLEVKAAMSASFFIVGVFEMLLGCLYCGTFCTRSLVPFLLIDGTFVCAGTTLGLLSIHRLRLAASQAEASEYLLPEGKERDASRDLTGMYLLASRLSDVTDVLIILLYLLGVAWYIGSGGVFGKCDDTLRSWFGWCLGLKLAAPLAGCAILKSYLHWNR